MSLANEPMTRPTRFETQCLGKRQFDTFGEAHRASKRFHTRSNIYRCPHCRQWHIGGKGPRFKQGE